MLRRTSVFGLVLLVCLSISVLPLVALEANLPPEVTDVIAYQINSMVKIAYDVSDPEDDILTISVAVSDDGGNTFTVPARTFLPGSAVWRGDDGLGIPSDPSTLPFNHEITWNAGNDVPDIFGTDFCVKITASDAGMVLIPAGPFLMGDSFGEGEPDELPVHEVYLDDFYIDVYEVTNAQYLYFIDATRYPIPPGMQTSAQYLDCPVTCITYLDAVNYAQWVGKRLPTEAEWEKAARGGLVGKRYPWGDSISPADVEVNPYYTQNPVGSYPPNGYGLYDMAGGASEWCADWYDSDYYSDSPTTNPQGPNSGTYRVVRGDGMRVAHRSGRYVGSEFLAIAGFRCAGDVIP